MGHVIPQAQEVLPDPVKRSRLTLKMSPGTVIGISGSISFGTEPSPL